MTSQIPPTKLQVAPLPSISWANPALDVWSYWLDASQRALLFLDVLQQRSEHYEEHDAKTAPHVLKFGCELIMDGRKLQRPVNYLFVAITRQARRSINTSGHSSSSIRVQDMALALVALNRRAKSAWP